MERHWVDQGMKEIREREAARQAEEIKRNSVPPRDLGPPAQEAANPGAMAAPYRSAEYLAERVSRAREKERMAKNEAREIQALLDHLPRVLSADAEAGLWRLIRGLS